MKPRKNLIYVGVALVAPEKIKSSNSSVLVIAWQELRDPLLTSSQRPPTLPNGVSSGCGNDLS